MQLCDLLIVGIRVLRQIQELDQLELLFPHFLLQLLCILPFRLQFFLQLPHFCIQLLDIETLPRVRLYLRLLALFGLFQIRMLQLQILLLDFFQVVEQVLLLFEDSGLKGWRLLQFGAELSFDRCNFDLCCG